MQACQWGNLTATGRRYARAVKPYPTFEGCLMITERFGKLVVKGAVWAGYLLLPPGGEAGVDTNRFVRRYGRLPERICSATFRSKAKLHLCPRVRDNNGDSSQGVFADTVYQAFHSLWLRLIFNHE